MLGAIIGDIIGSPYEGTGRRIRTRDFPLFSSASRFTDDTVLTVAVADAILHDIPYERVFRDYYRRYPRAGYGGGFIKWAQDPGAGPYNSLGNGSAMRVSPVAWAFDSLDDVMREGEKTALPTHNHPSGVTGAMAVAAAVFLARTGTDREDIRRFIQETFGYDLSGTVETIRPGYSFDVTCDGSVPQAIIAFLDSTSFEDAIRNAVSLGGDADTQAAIAGAIAEGCYGIPLHLAREALSRLDDPLRETVKLFRDRFAGKARAR